MQQGSARSIDDKPKDAEISPFQAGSDCSLSAKQKKTLRENASRNALVALCQNYTPIESVCQTRFARTMTEKTKTYG